MTSVEVINSKYTMRQEGKEGIDVIGNYPHSTIAIAGLAKLYLERLNKGPDAKDSLLVNDFYEPVAMPAAA